MTGIHRKAAIRLLRRPPRPPTARPRAGRPAVYGPAVAAAARSCGRPAAGSGPSAASLRARAAGPAHSCGELRLAPEVDKLVRQVSPATLARLLAPARATLPAARRHDDPPRHLAQARDPHPHLRRVGRRPARVPRGGSRRPLRPQHPGLLPLHPLRRGHRHHLGRARGRLGQGPGARRRRHPPRPQRLPMPLLGLDSDNGSEFINQRLYAGASTTASPSPAAAPTRRTTVPMSSRRTAPSSAGSSAMIASPPGPPMPSSRASISSPACTSTSSSPWRSS